MESLKFDSSRKNSDNNNNTNANKLTSEDIICPSLESYFPQPQIGKVCKRYINTIDYMVGMKEFEDVFKRLNMANVVLYLIVVLIKII